MTLRRLLLFSLLAAACLGVIAFRVVTRPFQPLDAHPMAQCSPFVPSVGRVFQVDPVRGSDDGDGSAERPWRDLRYLVAAGKLGEQRRELYLFDRAFAAVMHQVPVVRSREQNEALIRSGDTVLLAAGDYGPVDLSNLVNRGFVTLAAAPGASVRFAELNLIGASHFVFRGIAVTGGRSRPGKFLVNTHLPGPLRADNIVFDQITVSSSLPIGTTDPQLFADSAPNGVRLAGDCLTLRDSRLHDLQSAVNVYRGRRVTLANNTIHDFSADGVQFSGQHLTIRDNTVFDQLPTPSPLHPDCMHGQPPDDQLFGPVMISGNICARSFAGGSRDALASARADRFGWQGINIFDGRWRRVTVSCNVVLPAAQHGIALYGTEQSLIEHNVVAAFTKGRPSWIAAMPSHEGRQPSDVVIRENLATAYLNAVQNAPRPIDAMIAAIKVNPRDKAINATLRQPIKGVVLADNAWLVVTGQTDTRLRDDARFAKAEVAAIGMPRSAQELRRLYPLQPACNRPA